MKLFILQITVLLAFCNSVFGQNYRATFGVVTVPSQFPDIHPQDKFSSIDGNVVAFLESGGVRLVPIPWNLEGEKLDLLLQSVNGIVIAGENTEVFTTNKGGRVLTEWAIKVTKIVNYALEVNKNGTYFPLVGLNSGFTAISAIISDDLTIVDQFDGDLSGEPKYFKLDTLTSPSRICSLFNDPLKSRLVTQAILPFRNMYAIKTATFQKNPNLNNFFNVVATFSMNFLNKDVAIAEAKNYPVYILQLSPYLSNRFYNTKTGSVYESKYIVSLFANFLANETRGNGRAFKDSLVEDKSLIYQTRSEFINFFFPRVYFFN